MHFLREYDRIVLFSAYKTDGLKDFIEATAKVKVDTHVHLHDLFEKCTTGQYKTWRECYDELYTFGGDLRALAACAPREFDKFDDVYMFGAPQSEGGKLKRHKNGLVSNFDNKNFITFVSVAKLYFITYAAVALANAHDARYVEICYDPGENSVAQLEEIRPKDFVVHHGYDIPRLGMTKHTCYQDALKNVAWRPSPFDESPEVVDLLFGYSFMTRERAATHRYVTNFLEKLPASVSRKILVKNKVEGYDTSVPKDEYMRLLTGARFTLIAPAYEQHTFSCSRYMEALHYGALPLVLDCNEPENVRDFFRTYGIGTTEFYPTIVGPDDDLKYMADPAWESWRAETVANLRAKIFAGV